MRRLAWLLWLFVASPALAQIDAAQGYCNLGGTQALLSGMQSTNYQQGVVPGCTVTVYLTGTQSKPTIYADANSHYLSNPFTAVAGTSPNSGYWLFYANTGIGYDICMSGGTAPNNYPEPVCLTDVKIAHSSAGDGTVKNFASGNLLPLFTTSVSNPTTTPVQSFAQISQAAQTAFGNWAGTTGPPFFATFTCAGALNCSYNSGSNTFTLTATDNGITQLTGDVLAGPGTGSQAATLPTVNSTPGTCGDSSHSCQITTNGKGLTTAQSSIALSLASGMTMQTAPPASGQFAIVYFTASSGVPIPQPCVTPDAVIWSDPVSGFATACGDPVNPETASITWSAPTLPSYILPANVTHIYAVGYGGVASFGGGSGTTQCGTVSFNATPGVQFNIDMTADGFNGSNIGTLTCQASASDSASLPSYGAAGYNLIELYVYYTGTAPPASTAIQVMPPLYFNQSYPALGLGIPFDAGIDSGTSTAYAVALPGFPSQTPGLYGSLQLHGTSFWFDPAHTSTSTTPTLSLNGLPAANIVGPTGAALATGDLVAGVWARVVSEPGGNWSLQNPQVSGSGAVTGVSNSDGTLTFSPTTGAVVGSLSLAHANTWTAKQTQPAPLFSNVTGSTQCIQVDSTGQVSGTGSSCGSGSGTITQVVAGNGLSGGGSSGSVTLNVAPVGTVLDTSTPVTVSAVQPAEFHFNENATAATAVTYNLPTAAAGKQFCFANANNGSAANTGALTIQTSAAGQYIIFTDGTLSASDGYVASGGAAADSACVVGVDATHWMLYVQAGTWTKH